MPIHIRRLAEVDIAVVHRLGLKEPAFAFQEVQCFWTEDQLRAWFASQDDICLGAYDDGALIGFALTVVHIPTGKATFENLLVLPEARGQNVGDLLIGAMLAILRERRIFYVCLLTPNASLSGYFERFGFRHEGAFAWHARAP